MDANNREYPVMQARLTILIALLLFVSNGSIGSTPVYGPQLPTETEIIEMEQRQRAEQAAHRYTVYRQEREAELWNAIVEKIAEDLLIPDDLELADRIAHAIEESTGEFDVDPWLMVALMRVESAGNPDAISRVGARGLTQVMPATGREIAGDLGVEWEGVEMLHDVETSVRFGTYYMSKLLRKFEGNVHAAVAAYNWGPQNIASRLRRGKPLPVVYPSKVLGHATVKVAWASS